jgi:hypothetical protein
MGAMKTVREKRVEGERPKLDGYQKIESALYKFEKPGDFLQGTLMSYTPPTFADSSGIYQVREESGDLVRFYSTVVLARDLTKDVIGKEVVIVYLGEVKTRRGQTMKEFEVYVK